LQAICEIGYEKNGYVAYEVQRHNTSSTAVMNSAIGSFNNGKRIFLAAGRDSECHIYQIKLQPRVPGGSGGSKGTRELMKVSYILW
jgi:hypothetical protein